ncbi:MAG: CarD family transcriptional regulator, partial [Anaerolineales bacterium]
MATTLHSKRGEAASPAPPHPRASQLLLETLRGLKQYGGLIGRLNSNDRVSPLGLPRAARLPVLSALQSDLDRPAVLITQRADLAFALHDELGFWSTSPRLHLREPNPLFYEQADWGVGTRRDRLKALTTLAAYHFPGSPAVHKHPIIVASARAVMTKTVPLDRFLAACYGLTIGMSLAPESLRHTLVDLGFERTNTVLEPGQFSSRGGIVDLWPPAEDAPIRLDFFGDELDGIRRFDPASQRSIEDLQWILVAPAREYVPAQAARGAVWPGAYPRPGDSEITTVSEFEIPLLYPNAGTLLDYVPSPTLAFTDDLSEIEAVVDEVEGQAMQSRETAVKDGVLPPDFPVPYVTWSEIQDQLQTMAAVELARESEPGGPAIEQAGTFGDVFRHDERFGGRLKPFMDYVGQLAGQGHVVIIASRQRARLAELWKQRREQANEAGPRERAPARDLVEHVHFLEATLAEGFVLDTSHLITDSEIFGWQRPAPRARRRPGAETPETVYADLRPDDFVVHVDHGIGRYLGLVTRN